MIEGPNPLIDYGDRIPSDRPALTDLSKPHATNTVCAATTIYALAIRAQERIAEDHPADDIRYWVGRLDAATQLLGTCSVWTADQWLTHIRQLVHTIRTNEGTHS